MSLKSNIANIALITALAAVAVVLILAPDPGSRGPVVDAASVARETAVVARAVAHPLGRIRLLSEAARYLPDDEATPLLAEVRAFAETLENPGFRADALMQVAGIMTGLGLAEGPALARALVTDLAENGPTDPMLIPTMGQDAALAEQIRRIAQFQAMHGDVEGAEIAAGYQRREADKVETLFTVAGTLATRGDKAAAERLLAQALQRLAGIDDPARADAIKLSAIRALAPAGWVDEALAMVETITEITPRIEAVGILAQQLAVIDDVTRAREQYARIAGLPFTDSSLWALAMAVARTGGLDEARAMMADMQIPMMRDQAIADLAGIQAGQGDLNGALDIVADLPEGFQRDRGLRLVLTALVEAGRLEEAGDYAAGLADPGLRGMVIAPIAIARARAGNPAAALATARAQPTPDAQAAILLAIAEALAQMEKAVE